MLRLSLPLLLSLLLSTCVRAQNPVTYEFGTPSARATEQPVTMIPGDEIITTVYHSQGGPAGRESIVFARLTTGAGNILTLRSAPLELGQGEIIGLVTPDEDVVVMNTTADFDLVVRRYDAEATLLDSNTIAGTGQLFFDLRLSVTAEGSYVLRTRSSDRQHLWRIGADLRLRNVVPLPAPIDVYALPDDRSLLLAFSRIRPGYELQLYDETSAQVVSTSFLPGSDDLEEFATGRILRNPVTGNLHAILTRFNSAIRRITPVFYPIDADDLLPGEAFSTFNFPNNTVFILTDVSPDGRLLWRNFDQQSVFQAPAYEEPTEASLLTLLPLDLGALRNTQFHFAPDGTDYLLTGIQRNANDRDVLSARLQNGGVLWRAPQGISGPVTNDIAFRVATHGNGKTYVLSQSPSNQSGPPVPTLWRSREGAAPEKIWQEAVGVLPRVPVTLLSRSDGRLIIITQSATDAASYVLNPDGSLAFPPRQFSNLNNTFSLFGAPNLDLGGGVSATAINGEPLPELHFFRTDGLRNRILPIDQDMQVTGLGRLGDDRLIIVGLNTFIDRLYALILDKGTGIIEEINTPFASFTEDQLLNYPKACLSLTDSSFVVGILTVDLAENRATSRGQVELYRFDATTEETGRLLIPQPGTSFRTPLHFTMNPAGELLVYSASVVGNQTKLHGYRIDPERMELLDSVVSIVPASPTSAQQFVTSGADGRGHLLIDILVDDDLQLLLHSDRLDNNPVALRPDRQLPGQFRVFPVPARGPQTLEAKLPRASALQLTYLDASGRSLTTRQLPAAANFYENIRPPAGSTHLLLSAPDGRTRTLPLLSLR